MYNRTVVNVGADCGTSVLYFLLHGAKHVIAYESDDVRRNQLLLLLKELSLTDRVTVNGKWESVYDNADVFTMDCEGCESSLDVTQLEKYTQWCVAVHTFVPSYSNLIRQLVGLGGVVTYITSDEKEIVLCKW